MYQYEKNLGLAIRRFICSIPRIKNLLPYEQMGIKDNIIKTVKWHLIFMQ